MIGYMADQGLHIFANGYEIIPIEPGEKRPARQLRQWNTLEITEPLVRKWRSNGFADYGIGIRTGRIVFFDLDIPDKALCELVQTQIVKRLGMALVRYGNFPKRGLVYRTDKPFHKIQTAEYRDRAKRRFQLEVLGIGQQFVALAIHPDTGKPYEWIGASPMTTRATDLTLVSEALVREVVAEVEAMLAEAGLRTGGSRVTSTTGEQLLITDEDDIIGDAPLRDLTIDKLRRLVEQIPNDGVPYESNDYSQVAWLQMLMAIAHQTGKSDEGREIAYEWSIQSAKHSGDMGDAEFEKTWRSLEKLGEGQRPVTARYIVKWAAICRGESNRKLSDQFDSAIKSATTIEEVRQAAAILARIAALDPVDRELGAVEVKLATQRLGISMPIGIARNMVRYHQPAGDFKWLEGWCFLKHTGQFYNSVTGEAVDRGAFDAANARHVNEDTTPTWVAMRTAQIPVYHMTMYLPGEAEVFTDSSGLTWINTYRDRSPPMPARSIPQDRWAIKRVEAHAVHLFGEERRRDIEILHSTLAYIVQTRKRVNWLTLIQGAEKIGKSFYAQLMSAVLGGEPHIHELDSETLCNSIFTEWSVGHLFTYVEELKVHAKRYDVMNKLKPYITNSTVSVHPKGMRQYNAVNTSSYFAFTNYRDAVPLTDSDSRYFVLLSVWQDSESVEAFIAENPRYYPDLFAALQDSAGALRKWLMEYPLHPDFNPLARAPHSEGKQTIIDEAKSDLQIQIEDLIASGEVVGVSKDLIVIHLLRAALMDDGEAEIPKKQAIIAVLQRLQFRPIKGNRIKIKDRAKDLNQDFYCWTRNPTTAAANSDAVREMIVRNILPKLT